MGATTLEADRDIQLNRQAVPKGRYSVWMVPNPDEWTVILSREARAFHTRPPADSSTQVRFVVKPVSGVHLETLACYFPVPAGSGRFHPGWYREGKFFDVETDTAFIFATDAERVRP